jgi:radical SAM superfamily enzyme YgiQ (UPF0313 family)
MKKILLVAPMPLRFELTQDDSYLKIPLINAKSFLTPLHIATVAALTPDEFEVDLWDESVQGSITNETELKDYDLVGLTGYTAHMPRAIELANFFRTRDILVVVGGSGISTMPQQYKDNFDVMFIGEAELTWPKFLEDWKKGNFRKIYRQLTPVDLSQTSKPRWETIAGQIHSYFLGGIQTSRGCPYDCEFCDVSLLFGRKFRHKPIENVLSEVRELQRLGVRGIVFCDDNFAGKPSYTKELLSELIALNNSFKRPLGFATEVSIDVASDDKMLEMMADANFYQLFIGIESPNKDSLKETNKLQNFRSNLIDDVKKIQSYGISVRGSLIVGFDHDGKDIFDQHLQFVQEAFLAVPSIRVLMAPPGTRLWKRLKKEGRIIKTSTEGRYYGNPGTTNIIPNRMTRWELHAGYLDLIERVYDWDNFAVRMKGFISNIKRRPKVHRQSDQWKRLVPFIKFVFSLDKKIRNVLLGILWYTFRHASFMLPKITGVILRQFGYAVRPQLEDEIHGQIDLERSGDMNLEMEAVTGLVPVSFREKYNEIFPDVYNKVIQDIKDKNFADEILIEIFTRFLIHWKGQNDSFSSEYNKDLMNIVNSTVEEKNRMCTLDVDASQNKCDEHINLTQKQLADGILRAVENELIVA